MVTAGDHKGKTGEVSGSTPSVIACCQGDQPADEAHQADAGEPAGRRDHPEGPIHLSNVSPVVDGKPTRVRFERKSNGQKVRIAVRGGKDLGAVSAPKDGRTG
jgi:ribosomal protein L24